MNGCISGGIVSFDEDRNIFLGQPIVDAYLATEDTEFYGIIVHKSAENAVKEYIKLKQEEGNASHLENLFLEQRLHFKSGYYTQYHMRWFDFDDAKKYDPVTAHSKYTTLLKKIHKKTEGRGRRYIEYTIDAINQN